MKSLRLALLAVLPMSLIAACAGKGKDPSGEGGGATTSAATGADGDAGPDGEIGCAEATDCGALNDICGVGVCVNGACARFPSNEFGACDDGLYCTTNDACMGGACVGGEPVSCPAPDACNVGLCNEALKTCQVVPGNAGGPCEDGDPCTQTGVCMGGACAKGPPVSCSFLDTECSAGLCDPIEGCKVIPKNTGVACDNGKLDGCSYGICDSGSCVSVPQNDGAPCEDFAFCTINKKCAAGACVGEPRPCAPPDNPCKTGVCDESSFSCVVVTGNDGTSCEDGHPCTGGEACLSGQCVGGQPANEGAACDDKDGCTAGTTCASGACVSPTSEIDVCVAGDSCCPAACTIDSDKDCLYWVPGVQQDVQPSKLVGWSQCWSGTYDQSQPSLQTILTKCDKAKLLLACRPVGQTALSLLAMAPREDVLYDCGALYDCTKQSNGVGWYFDETYSWGFAPGGLPVGRASCDIGGFFEGQPEQRMCWHTSAGIMSSGYRCGDNFLSGDATWERLIFEAD